MRKGNLVTDHLGAILLIALFVLVALLWAWSNFDGIVGIVEGMFS